MLDAIFEPDPNDTSIASMIIDCLLMVGINNIVIDSLTIEDIVACLY